VRRKQYSTYVGFYLCPFERLVRNRSNLARIVSLLIDVDSEHHAVNELVEVTIFFVRFDAEDGAVFVDSVVVDRGSSRDVVHIQHLVSDAESNRFGPVPRGFEFALDAVGVCVVMLRVHKGVRNRSDRSVGLDTARRSRVIAVRRTGRTVVIVVTVIIIVVTVIVVTVVVVIATRTGGIGHRFQAERTVAVQVLTVEAREVLTFGNESPTIVRKGVTRSDLRTYDMVVRLEVPVGIPEVGAASRRLIEVVRTIVLRRLRLLIVARTLRVRIQNTDFGNRITGFVLGTGVPLEVESSVKLRVTNTRQGFEHTATERMETIVIHRFDAPRVDFRLDTVRFVSNTHWNKRVSIRIVFGRGSARGSRRTRGTDTVESYDHPQTTDLIDRSGTLLFKELVTVARPDVIVARSAVDVIIIDVDTRRVFEVQTAVNTVVHTLLRGNDRSFNFPPMMTLVVSDNEFRRGFPVGVELRRVDLARLFRVREGRRRIARSGVWNNVRNELRSAAFTSDDLVGRLRQADDARSNTTVQTFVRVDPAAELIVREGGE